MKNEDSSMELQGGGKPLNCMSPRNMIRTYSPNILFLSETKKLIAKRSFLV